MPARQNPKSVDNAQKKKNSNPPPQPPPPPLAGWATEQKILNFFLNVDMRISVYYATYPHIMHL